jgi:hypothetical protein
MERHGRIAHDLPPTHPYAFEVNELVPVSEYWLGGHPTPATTAFKALGEYWSNNNKPSTSEAR